MDSIFVEILEKELARAHGPVVKLLSREFLLDLKYLNFRAIGGRFIGGAGSMNVGEFVAYRLLQESDRAQIFTSPYDLGNPRFLDVVETRQGAIVDQLRQFGRATSDGDRPLENPEEVLKALKHVIRDLTGHDYRTYVGECVDSKDTRANSSTATRVLLSMYRYRRQWPKVFSRFRAPASEAKANLELRDAYPLKGFEGVPENGVAIFADLKFQVTLGMTTSERSPLLAVLKRIAARYAESRFFPAPFFASLLNHGRPSPMLTRQRIEEALPLGKRKLPERLDRAVLVGLALREVEHRIVGKENLNNLLMSQEAYVPAITGSLPAIIEAARSAVYQADKSGVWKAIRQLLREEFSNEEFEQADRLHLRLRWIIKSPLEHDQRFNLLEKIAALITCLGSNITRIKCKAYWHGKETTSERPLYYLENISGAEDVGRTPEFYLEFWFRRYCLVLCLLGGRADIWHQRNEIEIFEATRVIDVFRTNDFDDAGRIVHAYYEAQADPVAYMERVTIRPG